MQNPVGKKTIVFCWGNKGGANFQVGLQKHVISAALYWFFLFILATPCVGEQPCVLYCMCVVNEKLKECQ